MRAMAETLPTHKREAQRVESEKARGKLGPYTTRYKDLLQGGICQQCAAKGVSTPETVSHILHECPNDQATAIRSKAKHDIVEKWSKLYKSSTKGGAEWELKDPTLSGPEGWELWWGWAGLAPRGVEELTHKEVKLMKASCRILATAGHEIWGKRNEWVENWAKENEIPSAAKAKQEARQGTPPNPKEREPPPAPKAETTSKKAKTSGKEAPKKPEKIAANARRGMASYLAGAPLKVSSTKSTLSKRTKAAAANRDEADARGENQNLLDAFSDGAECAWQGCGKPARGEGASFCKRLPREPRCSLHAPLACRGLLQPCQCDERPGVGRKKLRGGAPKKVLGPNARGESDDDHGPQEKDEGGPLPPLEGEELAEAERTSKRLRCLDLGMEVENEGVKGTLVGMERTGHARDAFREPDVLWVRIAEQRELVAWNVTEKWRITKKILHMAANLNRARRPPVDAAAAAREERAPAADGPEKDYEVRACHEGGDEGLSEERHEQDWLDCRQARCLAGQTRRRRAPKDAVTERPHCTPGAGGESRGGPCQRTGDDVLQGERVGRETYRGQDQCSPRRHDEEQSEGERRLGAGDRGNPSPDGGKEGNNPRGQDQGERGRAEGGMESPSHDMGRREGVGSAGIPPLATGPHSKEGSSSGGNGNRVGRGHRRIGPVFRQGHLDGPDPTNTGRKRRGENCAGPADELPGSSKTPRRRSSQSPNPGRGETVRTGSNLGEPLVCRILGGPGAEPNSRGGGWDLCRESSQLERTRRGQGRTGSNHEGPQAGPDSPVLRGATCPKCDEGPAGCPSDPRHWDCSECLRLGGKTIGETVSVNPPNPNPNPKPTTNQAVAQPRDPQPLPPYSPSRPSTLPVRGVQAGSETPPGLLPQGRPDPGEIGREVGGGCPEQSPSPPGSPYRVSNADGETGGNREPQIEPEWLLQARHEMPEVGDAEPRPFYLATHRPAVNDGAAYCRSKSGINTVNCSPFYRLTTSEYKRAKVSREQIDMIVEAIGQHTDPTADLDYRGYDDIAGGNFIPTRTRKKNRTSSLAQEYLPEITWDDLEPDPGAFNTPRMRGAALSGAGTAAGEGRGTQRQATKHRRKTRAKKGDPNRYDDHG